MTEVRVACFETVSSGSSTSRECVSVTRESRVSEASQVSESFDTIAKRIEAKPWNRPGTDKTWVLNAMADQLRFRAEVRKSKRVR